jgi:hypothetical protein
MEPMAKQIRVKVRDGGRVVRTRDVAEKTLVAIYSGPEYIAEREGSDLKVYVLGQDGLAGVKTGDRAVADALRSIKELQSGLSAISKSASDFWDEQSAKQAAALNLDRKR